MWPWSQKDEPEEREREASWSSFKKLCRSAHQETSAYVMSLERQMDKFLTGGGCSCNYEPSFFVGAKDNRGFVAFASEQIYNAFMIQMALCTLENINAPRNSVTYRVRNGLDYTKDQMEWARARIINLVDNFQKFQGGRAADPYTPGVGDAKGWWIKHKQDVHAQFFALYRIDRIDIPRLQGTQPIAIEKETVLKYETDHELPRRVNAQAFGIPAS